MTFVIATAVLVVTLIAAALIAPRPVNDLTLRMDPCALEPRAWGVIDPGCPDMHMGRPSWTRANTILDSEIDYDIAGRPDAS